MDSLNVFYTVQDSNYNGDDFNDVDINFDAADDVVDADDVDEVDDVDDVDEVDEYEECEESDDILEDGDNEDAIDCDGDVVMMETNGADENNLGDINPEKIYSQNPPDLDAQNISNPYLDGFILDSLVQRFGKTEILKHLTDAFHYDVEDIKRVGHFNRAFPTSVRRMILGYAWKNTSNIACVCKLWADDVNSPEYWRFAIREYIKIDFPYSPFLRIMGVSKQAKLGWLFTRSLMCVSTTDDAIILHIAKHNNYGTYKWKFYPTSKRHLFVETLPNNFKIKVDLELPNNFIGCTWKRTQKKVVHEIRWQDPSRDIAFEGQGNDECLPHGDGTWMKFSDKMFLLAGENVAQNGKMSFVDCKRLKIDEL